MNKHCTHALEGWLASVLGIMLVIKALALRYSPDGLLCTALVESRNLQC